MMKKYTVLAAICAFAWINVSTQAFAGSFQKVALPPVVPAPDKIEMDGKLDEWKAVGGYSFDALSTAVKPEGNKEVEALLAIKPSVNLRTAYDSDVLYVALEWKDAAPTAVRGLAERTGDNWADVGRGAELHIVSEKRVLHLVIVPGANGKGVVVLGRYDYDKKWQDVTKDISWGASDKKGAYAIQEVAIPWSLITKSGKVPAIGKLELGADFAWNAIDAKMLEKIRRAEENGYAPPAAGTEFSFLTARPAQVEVGYLPNPGDWGELVFSSTGGGEAGERKGSPSKLQVPLAKTPPAVDGTLNGWDEGKFYAVSNMSLFGENRYHCKVGAQYDAQNLYITAHFSSFGPMFNIKSENSQQGFRGGDALQLRITDGKKKVNLCGWYDSVTKASALTSDGKDLPNPFLLQQGAKQAFKVDDDGRGYVQQIALPWNLLFGSAPKEGSSLKATFQMWCADMTPRYSLFGKLSLQKRGALPVAFKMPANGNVTLGLYDAGGNLVRWILADDYRESGERKDFWNGLDQWGSPVPAGKYMVKGIYHAPLDTEYALTVGNPGNPPWPTPDDKGDWLSDEATTQAAVTDGKWVFLGAPGNEKGFSIIAVDEKGQRQWGFNQPIYPRCVSLAVEGEYLYAVYSGPELAVSARSFNGKNAIDRAILVCLDKKTGKPARFMKAIPNNRILTWPYREEQVKLWDLRNNMSYSPANYGGQPRYFSDDVGESTNVLGIAAVGNQLYISAFYDNKILVIDAEKGKLTGEEIAVPTPVGLHALNGDTILAVSGTQVVKVNVRQKTVTPVITSGLLAPYGVTTDKDGNIYVSDWGKSFQVKVYSADGKFLRAVGKEGGRPWVGKWEAKGMLVPRGIAVTDEGKLWVAEDDSIPKRVSVWDAKSGSFLRDYVGPLPYGGGTTFWIDPKDPTIVNCMGVRFKVDYAKKTYVPEAINLRRAGLDDAFMPNAHGLLPGTQGKVLYREGKEYIVLHPRTSMWTVLVRNGDAYKPVASVGNIHQDWDASLNRDGTSVHIWDSDIRHHVIEKYFPDVFRGHLGENYSWVDKNGDGLVQADEMTWQKAAKSVAYADGVQAPIERSWGNGVGSDFSYYFWQVFKDKIVIFKLPVKEWTKEGVPVYDITQAKSLIEEDKKNQISALYVTKDDKLIVNYEYEEYSKAVNVYAGFDLNGKRLWNIARSVKQEGGDARFAQVEDPRKKPHSTAIQYDFVLPKLGNVFATWLWHGSWLPYLITTDGLFAGSLLDSSTKIGPNAAWDESMKYYYQAPDGTPYIINGANQQAHILKIKGLEKDKVGRFEFPYKVSEEDVKLAAELREVPEQKELPKPILSAGWATQVPQVDGDLADWSLSSGVSMEGTNGRSAQVALKRDGKNLYLAYKVRKPKPMVNGGGDWRQLFITGDCVDLMLASNPAASATRREAAEGDLRLLFSIFDDKPIAVLYKPVVPGTKQAVQFMGARIDEVIKLESAKVAVKKDAGDGTYTVEAAVPLKDIGIDPKKADLRGDVGVVYADETGKSRSLRLYYYNQKTQMTTDLTTEATLQPAEWGSFHLSIGPNLIKNGSFEEPLGSSVSDSDNGWYVDASKNGNVVELSDDVASSGKMSLLMQTVEKVTFPPEVFNNPDYEVFRKSANGGAGGGFVEVRQKVPVTAGHQYYFAFRFRAEDFMPEIKKAGKPRGYVAFGGRIEWIGKFDVRPPSIGIAGFQDSQFEWKTVVNPDRSHFYSMPTPYKVPEGATEAWLMFSLVTLTDEHMPKLYLDDVELVDVTE